jgi:transposase
MPSSKAEDNKRVVLQKHGILNPRPRDVTAPLFQENAFFDARDLVQVKYEMLRWVRVDGGSISQSAKLFGFSRPSYYQAQMAFEEDGLVGLIPEKRGPKRAHKLNSELLDFVAQAQATQPTPRFRDLAQLIEERFGFRVHPRSIERALARRKKNAH